MKQILIFIKSKFKYLVVLAVFASILLFMHPYNYRARWRYNRQIKQLEQEIDAYKRKTAEDRLRKEQIGNNPEDLERFARERYLMKGGDEDIYIVYGKTE